MIRRFGGVTEEYKFYNGDITLRYDVDKHLYLLLKDNQLIPQDGVTNICHIVDKSNVLIPWSCRMMEQKLLSLVGTDDPVTISQEGFKEKVKLAKIAHKDKLEDAGEVGHAAHGWIEKYIKALIAHTDYRETFLLPEFPKEERAVSCIKAALKWIQAHNVLWIHTEKKIYSRDYGYAGTMDGLAHVDSCNDPECCPVPFKDKLSVIDWKTSNYLYIEFILQTAAYKQAYEEEHNVEIEDIWVIRLGKEDGEFQAWHVPSFLQHLGWLAFQDALNLSRSMRDIEESLQLIKDEKRAVEKEKELAAKLERLKVKCKGADKYKGIRKPRCNNGNPCQTCLAKYAEVNATTTSV